MFVPNLANKQLLSLDLDCVFVSITIMRLTFLFYFYLAGSALEKGDIMSNRIAYSKTMALFPSNTIHHGIVIRCPMCPFLDLSPPVVKKHVYSEHFGGCLIKCSECDYSCYIMSHFKRHLANMHGAERKLKCKYEGCDKSYINRWYLRDHLLVHENLKSFKCIHCNYASNAKRNLKKHMKTKHSTFRPYKCFCGKSYVYKCNLTVHWKRKHPGLIMKIRTTNGVFIAQC